MDGDALAFVVPAQQPVVPVHTIEDVQRALALLVGAVLAPETVFQEMAYLLHQLIAFDRLSIHRMMQPEPGASSAAGLFLITTIYDLDGARHTPPPPLPATSTRSAQVWATREVFIQNDLLTVPDGEIKADEQVKRSHGLRSVAYVSLTTASQPVGVLAFSSRRSHAFDTTALAPVISLLPHLATTMSHVILAAEAQSITTALARSNHALAMVTACHQAILRATTEIDLLQSVCEAIVDKGFRLAWAGKKEYDRTYSIRIIGSAGPAKDYINTLSLSWGTNKLGMGPAGRVARTGDPVVCHNIQQDPAMAPWHAAAATHNLQSVLALPLSFEGTIVGVLNLYAGQVDSFRPDDVILLQQLAQDISHALFTITDQQARRQAEQRLARAEARYRRIVETAQEGIWESDAEGYTTFVNVTMATMLGSTPHAMLGQHIARYIPPADQASLANSLERRRQGVFDILEGIYIREDGSTFWASINTSPVRSTDGTVVGTLAMVTDITERRQAEDRLRASDRLHRALEENLADNVLILDQDGYVRYVSASHHAMLGYNRDALLGRQIFDLMHPDDRPAMRQRWIQRLHDHTITATSEMRILHSDGSWRWFETITTDRQHDPDIRGMVVTARDMTERRQQEELLRSLLTQNAQLAAAVHSMSTGLTIATASPPYTILFANPAFCTMTGYTLDEALGQGSSFLGGPETDSSSFAAIAHAGSAVKEKMITVRSYRKDGSTFWNELTIIPICNDAGQLTHFATLNEDISNRVATMEALITARQIAEEATAAKTDFLSRVSHELRTPLNAILGFAQLLELEESLDPILQDNVNHILTAGEHLVHLIDDVLDLSRIEQGHLAWEPEVVSMAQCVRSARLLVQEQARARDVAIDALDAEACSYSAWADPHRMRQIAVNLLSNAVKYTPPGGRVGIDVKDGDLFVRLLVCDSGPGISQEKQQRLFHPFDRLDAERSDVPGVGLGLAVAQSLAQEMGGAVGVQSALGEGSTFWVDLPRPHSI